jgi:hypothetical protein
MAVTPTETDEITAHTAELSVHMAAPTASVGSAQGTLLFAPQFSHTVMSVLYKAHGYVF